MSKEEIENAVASHLRTLSEEGRKEFYRELLGATSTYTHPEKAAKLKLAIGVVETNLGAAIVQGEYDRFKGRASASGEPTTGKEYEEIPAGRMSAERWINEPLTLADLNRDMFRDYDYRTRGAEIKPAMAFRLALVWARMALNKAEQLKRAGIKIEKKVYLIKIITTSLII